ncbi:MAG: signal recognition particle receptor subunit alpha [Promethearchaeota archaeon]
MPSLGESLRTIMRRLSGISYIDEKMVKELTIALQRALLDADVNADLVISTTDQIKDRALKDKVPMGVSRVDYVKSLIFEELAALLGTRHHPLRLKTSELNIFMFVGIQGSGKTTTLAKLTRYLQRRNHNIGVIAGDTFRPGAYEQLQQLLEPLNAELFGDPKEKNALKVVKKGINYFKEKRKIDVILIDTSGRHKEEKGLIKEMKEIAKVAKPTEVILVVDGTIGQAAMAQAHAFNEATDIGSIIVTKLDGTAKGGGALSAVAASGAPIRFYGEGEKIEDLEDFDPIKYIRRITGIADIDSIAKTVADAGLMIDDADMLASIKKGKITLRLMSAQLEKAAHTGALGSLMGKMGFGGANFQFDEAKGKEGLKRFLAICKAMTPEELDSPNPHKFLNFSRRQRIARGSGTSVQEVQALLKQYKMIQGMIKRSLKAGRRKGGIPGIPPGMMPPGM